MSQVHRVNFINREGKKGSIPTGGITKDLAKRLVDLINSSGKVYTLHTEMLNSLGKRVNYSD